MSLKLTRWIERKLPEQRLFLKTDDATRFVRLGSYSQAFMLAGGAIILSWTILATAILLMDSISAGSTREQAAREQQLYEDRLNSLSASLRQRVEEARLAQERFNVALREVSEMQSRLLASEDRRRELSSGIEVIQSTLRRTIKERDATEDRLAELQAELEAETGNGKTNVGLQREMEGTIDFLAGQLSETAEERDEIDDSRLIAEQEIAELKRVAKLNQARQDRVLSQLEDAVSISLEPLDKMFAVTGMSTDRILDTVREGYSGQGGPLVPVTMSTKGVLEETETSRVGALFERLDELNMYRIAAENIPYATPVSAAYRLSSKFGMRRDPKNGSTKMHSGWDMAAPAGTAVYAPADGVVIQAGWAGAYGRLIKIQHEFGYETRFAHLLRIRVKPGQRVSRGDRIGDIGSSGRSTGNHLHYEVRLGGKAVNPMSYIKAATDVF